MICRRIVALLLPTLLGCSVAELSTADRMARGLIVVLPGIEGRSAFNVDVARGLADGGVMSAIEIYDWSVPIPFVTVLNLADLERNREQAAKIARRIRQYQSDYPGRTVYLVGHSAGAGVAVLALEALPSDHPITAALLLGPALGPHHDLRRALRRTEIGVISFYSPRDIFFLNLGTGVLGTVDRELGAAAGAVGFRRPPDRTGRDLYAQRLYQIKWSEEMSRVGNLGGHMGWTAPGFVRKYLAPLVLQQQRGDWPRGVWTRLVDASRSSHAAKRPS